MTQPTVGSVSARSLLEVSKLGLTKSQASALSDALASEMRTRLADLDLEVKALKGKLSSMTTKQPEDPSQVDGALAVLVLDKDQDFKDLVGLMDQFVTDVHAGRCSLPPGMTAEEVVAPAIKPILERGWTYSVNDIPTKDGRTKELFFLGRPDKKAAYDKRSDMSWNLFRPEVQASFAPGKHLTLNVDGGDPIQLRAEKGKIQVWSGGKWGEVTEPKSREALTSYLEAILRDLSVRFSPEDKALRRQAEEMLKLLPGGREFLKTLADAR
jgi:hypothetical protein